MVEAHVSLDRRHLRCPGLILNVDGLVDGLENALQVGDRGKQRVVKGGQGVDRVPELADVGGQGDHKIILDDLQPGLAVAAA